MISKLLRDIELLEMHTLHMISKHMKISLTSKVYYFMVTSVEDDEMRYKRRHRKYIKLRTGTRMALGLLNVIECFELL